MPVVFPANLSNATVASAKIGDGPLGYTTAVEHGVDLNNEPEPLRLYIATKTPPAGLQLDPTWMLVIVNEDVARQLKAQAQRDRMTFVEKLKVCPLKDANGKFKKMVLTGLLAHQFAFRFHDGLMWFCVLTDHIGGSDPMEDPKWLVFGMDQENYEDVKPYLEQRFSCPQWGTQWS